MWLIAIGAVFGGLMAWGLACDARRWLERQRARRRLRALRARYLEGEEAEERAVEGFCRYLAALADEVIAIRQLPEIEPKRRLNL